MEATRTRKRQHLTAGQRQAMQAEALDRAQHGRTCGNDLLILTAFAARGIDAHPRADCYTFNAWKALHRHVKKGEHGVHVPVYVHTEKKNDDGTTEEHTIPTGACVFHISQTDPDDEPTYGVAITADGVAPCRLQGDTITLQAEDDHEAAILAEEQREEATTTDAQPVLF